MRPLRADTLVKVIVGPLVSVSDGFTRVSTFSLSAADVAELVKNDSDTVVDISGNTLTPLTGAAGYYALTITAAQLDTEGGLAVLLADDSLILPYQKDLMVMNANAWDALYAAAGTDYLQVDTKQMNSTNVLGAGTSLDKWRGA